jgi:hypothetical protein
MVSCLSGRCFFKCKILKDDDGNVMGIWAGVYIVTGNQGFNVKDLKCSPLQRPTKGNSLQNWSLRAAATNCLLCASSEVFSTQETLMLHPVLNARVNSIFDSSYITKRHPFRRGCTSQRRN